MSDYEKLASVVQIVVAILAFISVYLVVRQIKILTSQLKATQLASEAQSIISIVEFLQTTEAREARETVRAKLSELHHDAWDERQNQHASLACANYDVVAALLRVDLIQNKHVIIENWAPSIIHCHRVLSPFIEKKRILAGGDRKYWSNFDWLRDQCPRS
ncbi:hypothetical protein DYL61_24245 [Pseudomonas nabeulensis]|uniref:DUF4760 domain-containing protein n=1 Tax=Pseudomonas nabeulensis TaxID=2293833 RepID=A0A4Z0AQ32_9PSED|nr:hypothetical protein [Pseudomonas nabeulensis]TFY88501.1 hypothetical protein DYL61_24245 [Pseudomonas nabeulensis]